MEIATKVFKHRLDSILKDNAIERYVGNKKRGKLDFNALHKISHSNKVFKQKEERKGKDYSISFLVDISGSMGSVIHEIACIVQDYATTFTELEMNPSYFTFSDGTYQVYPKAKDRFGVADAILDSYAKHSSGTDDALALHIAGNEICKKNKKNILIVFSDGDGQVYKIPHDWQDTSRHDPDDYVYMRQGVNLYDLKSAPAVLRGLKIKYSDLEVVCVSLNHHRAVKVYGTQRTVVIRDASESRRAIVKLLSKIIKRA